jgi:hypothetical protein
MIQIDLNQIDKIKEEIKQKEAQIKECDEKATIENTDRIGMLII